MVSCFKDVKLAPPIEVFALNKAFLEDTFPEKVNLGIGAYRDDQGKPWVLPVVRKVEQQIASNPNINHEYLPVLGMDAFSKAALHLLLGSNNLLITEGKAFGIQGLSGTGSLRVGAEFLARILKYNVFYVSDPSWGNHKLLFTRAGFENFRQYRYWDDKNYKIDLNGMLEDLSDAPPNAVIILHACAHNPTGMDPTPQEWEKIASIIHEKKLFPFFDMAYQGFASGDPDKDAFAVRLFASRGMELFCAQSFAKNFGLYNERIGNLTVILNDTESAEAVHSQLTLIVRAMYSNPPHHGARVVATILHDPELQKEWYLCIQKMSQRIKNMRIKLKDCLEALHTPGDWKFITQQIGMFSYTGLKPKEIQYLISNYHIYLLSSGRINICGLTSNNIDYVSKAINDVITKFRKSQI